MFSPLIKKTFDITDSNKTINIYVETDEDDYIYPDMKIIMKQGGTLNIKNSTEIAHRDFSIENLSSGEIITIDGSLPDIASSSETHSGYSVMNTDMDYGVMTMSDENEVMNYGISPTNYDTATTSTYTKTYLYNKGDECTSITGGWKLESELGVGTIQKKSDHIYMHIPKSNKPTIATNVEYLSMTNIKGINFTNYSKLYMTYAFTGYNNQIYEFPSGSRGYHPIEVLMLEDPQYDYMSGLHDVIANIYTTNAETQVDKKIFDYETSAAFRGGDIMYYNGIKVSLTDYDIYDYPSIECDLTLKIYEIWVEDGSTPSITSITLNASNITLTEGDTRQLTATTTPYGADVSWSSSNSSIARVSNGLVTAVSKGTATITATSGSVTATCTVTVTSASIDVTNITLNTTSLTLTVGETSQLLATVTPSNATNKSVTWLSGNTSIATVSNGKVTAISEGITTITAQAGSKMAVCTVIVNAVIVENPNIYQSFNKNWIRFVDGKNTLTFDKNCTVEFEYREIRKVGVFA